MTHEDFFLATLIEFTQWIRGEEQTVAKYERFGDLPTYLMDKKTSEIVLNQKNWKILEINQDLRSHGYGRHIKVRLEPIP